jgi:flagellar protein FliS
MCAAQANPGRPEPNAYLRTKVETAGPAELRLMLFDGALKFAEQGKNGLARADFESAYEGISRCQEILIELISGLQPEQDPKLCKTLSALYTFMYTRLVDASRERKAAVVEEVIGLLRYERETWSMLLERLAQENAAAKELATTPDAQPPDAGSRPASPLVGGTVSVKG